MIDRLRAAATTDTVMAADIESLAGRVAKDIYLESAATSALHEAIAAYRRSDQLCPSAMRSSMPHRCCEWRVMTPPRQPCRSGAGRPCRARGCEHLLDDATRGEAALLLGKIDERTGTTATRAALRPTTLAMSPACAGNC